VFQGKQPKLRLIYNLSANRSVFHSKTNFRSTSPATFWHIFSQEKLQFVVYFKENNRSYAAFVIRVRRKLRGSEEVPDRKLVFGMEDTSVRTRIANEA
jgi:hypothetical protein